MKYINPLSSLEKETLGYMYRYHPKPRVRMRSHSILLSGSGYSIAEIVKLYGVDRRSVSSCIDRWEQGGLAGLYDQPRSGRRSTFSETEQSRVVFHLNSHPQQIKKVINEMQKETGKTVSPKTIRRIAKKARYKWKRMKRGTAKSPNPLRYERCQKSIQHFQKQEDEGNIDLRYFDASGFSLYPCVPYAWQPIGENILIPASKSKRINVLAFMNRNNDLFPFIVDGAVNSAVVIACFDSFVETIKKKTVVFMDNAPIHKSKEFIQNIRRWVEKGLIIKFLPTYSPLDFCMCI